MGRLALRVLWDIDGLDVVHVNEVAGGVECAAHLLEYDTVHGRWDRGIYTDGEGIHIEGRTLGFSEHAQPGDVPWRDSGIDIVLECSGQFRTTERLAPYFEGGVKKVIVAAPVKDGGALNIVMGCNDSLYDPDTHHLVTAASCTTNCIAPVVKVIHEQIGIRHGVVTTMHNATNTQVVVDAPHTDLRRARSALNSLIPTTTGSATAITLIYPELKGKLNGLAVRVPLLNASLTDCVFEVERDVTKDTVNGLLQDAAEGPLAGVLGFEPKPLVSTDFVNDTRSGTVDGPATMVVDGTLVKILVWYDNEIGYVHRMADLTRKIGLSLNGTGGPVRTHA
jgi:glyceraldehyde 3-phosphate dehydrogenase